MLVPCLRQSHRSRRATLLCPHQITDAEVAFRPEMPAAGPSHMPTTIAKASTGNNRDIMCLHFYFATDMSTGTQAGGTAPRSASVKRRNENLYPSYMAMP